MSEQSRASRLSENDKVRIKNLLRRAMLLHTGDNPSLRPLSSNYYLEGLDPLHRDKTKLQEKFVEWKKEPNTEENRSFWVWLQNKYPSFENAKQIDYLKDKEERNKYLLHITTEGLIFRGREKNLFDTRSYKGKRPGYAAYVMAPDGFLFAAEHQSVKLQHSTFLGGRPVLSAGMIKVEEGKIKDIDHRSGHYAPTAEHFKNCLSKLNPNAFSNDATVKISGEIKSRHTAAIAAFFKTIRTNRFFNWLPDKGLTKLEQLGYHLEHNNAKFTTIKAEDFYKNSKTNEYKLRIEELKSSSRDSNEINSVNSNEPRGKKISAKPS